MNATWSAKLTIKFGVKIVKFEVKIVKFWSVYFQFGVKIVKFLVKITWWNFQIRGNCPDWKGNCQDWKGNCQILSGIYQILSEISQTLTMQEICPSPVPTYSTSPYNQSVV